MPLPASFVGTSLGSVTAECDARWLMAYAAGVPDERPELYDTEGTLAVHACFAVAPEWELLVRSSEASPLTGAERRRGVHAGHDLLVHRPVRAGEHLVVEGTVVGVGRTKAGAVQHTLFSAVAATNREPVWSTLMTSVFRGVDLHGDPVTASYEWPEAPLAPAEARPMASIPSYVRTTDAHTYTECARIWNPIHTDVAVAKAAGLHAPILHGTATMARAVSIATSVAGRAPGDVRRVCARFGAMVDLGAEMRIDILAVAAAGVHLAVRNHEGAPALRDGYVGFATS
jgi:acyl dehydratase